jgi:hypothetical protein
MIATMRLDLALDMDHELVRLAGVIAWGRLVEDFEPLYCADNGRPAVSIRLMAGLHFLKHLKGISPAHPSPTSRLRAPEPVPIGRSPFRGLSPPEGVIQGRPSSPAPGSQLGRLRCSMMRMARF